MKRTLLSLLLLCALVAPVMSFAQQCPRARCRRATSQATTSSQQMTANQTRLRKRDGTGPGWQNCPYAASNQQAQNRNQAGTETQQQTKTQTQTQQK
jgi:hypothetical protein